jgi:hypothetical protein
MMWMLVTVICAASGLDAECDRHIRPAVKDRSECIAMIKPTMDYLTALAEESGVKVIFLSARCEPGRDG